MMMMWTWFAGANDDAGVATSLQKHCNKSVIFLQHISQVGPTMYYSMMLGMKAKKNDEKVEHVRIRIFSAEF